VPLDQSDQWQPGTSPRRIGVALRYSLASVALGVLAVALGPSVGVAQAGAPTPTIGGPALAANDVVVHLLGSAPPLPTIGAASFVVADLASGDVLAAKSAHLRLPPASTLKVLTADVLLPRLDPADTYTGSADDAAVEGSKVGIDPGLTYTVDQLFKGMLLMSGNDAARALATAAGGEAATIELMNDRARELQALDTTATTVSGLDDPGQVSSAYDLALITRDAMRNPAFRDYVAQRIAQFPNRDGGTYQIQNLNRLLGAYDGAIGVKTGYTTLARTTYVGAATRGGHTILVTVMKVEGRGEVPAAALLDWAFAAYSSIEPVGTLVDPQLPETEPPATSTPDHSSSAAPTHTSGPSPADDPGDNPAAAGESDDSGGGNGTLRGVALAGGTTLGAVAALRARALWRMRKARRSRTVQRRPAPPR
jgi:D-alanyl-D-alanine carboxypeptidase (penicillin-binding protein 5/6)